MAFCFLGLKGKREREREWNLCGGGLEGWKGLNKGGKGFGDHERSTCDWDWENDALRGS